ncbi:MAG: hypothetical protein JJT75_11870, partial [Opitutales bacterium]|nr:hypothetical protein [Opitutales bacterium]
TTPRDEAVTFRFTSVHRFRGVQTFTDWMICFHDHTSKDIPVLENGSDGAYSKNSPTNQVA